MSSGVEMTHCHLRDILYDTDYTVRVRAVNSSGYSDYSDSIILRTGTPPIQFALDNNTAHVSLKVNLNSSYCRESCKQVEQNELIANIKYLF